MTPMTTDRETRVMPISGMELREIDGDPNLRLFTGYAAVFNQITDIGGFREQVAPGAFRKTLREARNVAFLFNHDENTVMASTQAGTLRMREDRTGLKVEADLDLRDDDSRQLFLKMSRGDVKAMSFAFSVVKDEWDEGAAPPLRTLREVKLYDASAVVFPAYPQTSAEVRSRLAALGINPAPADADEELREEPYRPTAAMAEEAQRGLDWREEFGRGGTAVGVARARDISNRRPISLDTVGRMVSYFARHQVDAQGEGWSQEEDGYPSAGRIAWALWGGDAGRSWANAIWERDGRSFSDPEEEEMTEDSPALDVREIDRRPSGPCSTRSRRSWREPTSRRTSRKPPLPITTVSRSRGPTTRPLVHSRPISPDGRSPCVGGAQVAEDPNNDKE